MKLQTGIVVWIILVFAVAVSAQRTITNGTLETYRQHRAAADRDYRENYQKWGMPSPEELDKRREQSRLDTEILAERLRNQHLQREILDTQRWIDEQSVYSLPLVNGNSSAYSEPFIFGTSAFGFDRRGFRRGFRSGGIRPQTGYFAGGQFWPTGSATRPMPIFRIGGGHTGGRR
jgi:hypothetical protein